MGSDPQQISEQMASLEDDAAIGYIHNVSPMKSDNFFECQVQTESKVMRAVCFSPQKRKQILDYSKDDVPLKIQKFRIETKYNSEDKTVLQKYHDITFTKDSLPKTTEVQTIASLKSLCIGQLVLKFSFSQNQLKLPKKIEELGKIAKEAILNPASEGRSNDDDDDNNDDDENTLANDIDNEVIAMPEVDDDEFRNETHNINKEIGDISSPSPPSNTNPSGTHNSNDAENAKDDNAVEKRNGTKRKKATAKRSPTKKAKKISASKQDLNHSTQELSPELQKMYMADFMVNSVKGSREVKKDKKN
ncbi:hypothetical protein AC249_AIPGENE16681 [Exaiptasia diaphana]|nr:hypothetical protein AC249_AIPGENE16681 [Exaiptasia diaphana]